jgi:hypothetical protein
MALPASASAQQNGLVNVNVSDVVLQLPIGIAANVCDVNVAVLAQLEDEAAPCTAAADPEATVGPPQPGDPPPQEGLINVNVSGVTVQVPIAVAANVCDVNVAVLAELVDSAAACDADASSVARGRGNN